MSNASKNLAISLNIPTIILIINKITFRSVSG